MNAIIFAFVPDTPKDWESTNQGKAKNAFNQNAQTPNADIKQGHGSDMLKNQAPIPSLKPKGPIRDAVDRAMHNQQVERERQEAEARKQELLNKRETSRSTEQNAPPRDQTTDQKLARAKKLNSLTQEFNKQAQGRSQGRSMGR